MCWRFSTFASQNAADTALITGIPASVEYQLVRLGDFVRMEQLGEVESVRRLSVGSRQGLEWKM
jgi:hypothetical protein